MKTVEELTEEFGSDCDSILIWVTAQKEFMRISKGAGDNIPLESEEDVVAIDGCDEYLYYEIFVFNECDEFINIDGGMLDYNSAKTPYNKNLFAGIPAVLDIAYDDANLEFAVLQKLS